MCDCCGLCLWKDLRKESNRTNFQTKMTGWSLVASGEMIAEQLECRWLIELKWMQFRRTPQQLQWSHRTQWWWFSSSIQFQRFFLQTNPLQWSELVWEQPWSAHPASWPLLADREIFQQRIQFGKLERVTAEGSLLVTDCRDFSSRVTALMWHARDLSRTSIVNRLCFPDSFSRVDRGSNKCWVLTKFQTRFKVEFWERKWKRKLNDRSSAESKANLNRLEYIDMS